MSQIQQNGDDTTGNYFQGTSTNNNSGSIIAGGSNPVRNLVKQNPKGHDVGAFASVVVENDTVLSNVKAIDAGTFAHDHVKPISAKITSELAGVNNTAILRGDDKVTRSIHKIESFITNRTATAFRAGFNMYTGAFSGAVTTATDSLGSDVAANPTAAVPGKLTYQTGSNSATVDTYQAKTSA